MASLREVFDALVGEPHHDPVDLLRESGFDLSEGAATDALVNYAHSAPVEVAAHLQGFVMAHGPVPPEAPVPAGLSAGDGLGLLATAPVVVGQESPDLDDVTVGADGSARPAHVDDLDFGTGTPGGGDDAGGSAADGTLADGTTADAAAADDLGLPVDIAVDPLDTGAGPWQPPAGREAEDADGAGAPGDIADA